jgi:hypothetical protein
MGFLLYLRKTISYLPTQYLIRWLKILPLHTNLDFPVGEVSRQIIKWNVCFLLSFVIRRVCIVAKSAYHLRHVYLSVCPSARIYQQGSNWKDFCEIWYWRLSWKPVMKAQIRLESYKIIEHFTQRPKEVSLLLATLYRHKRAPSAEVGRRLFVRSSVPSDRLSVHLAACIRTAPYPRIYVKLYNGDFYVHLSRNYKFV